MVKPTIAIHQPNFMPWAGYFYKIAKADKFVLLDNAQFSKNSYINRSQILVNGKIKWLTVPARPKLGTSIDQVMVGDKNWKIRHIEVLKNAYAKAPYFNEIFPQLACAYENIISTNLHEINIHFIRWFLKNLNIQTEILKASEMLMPNSFGQTDRLVGIATELGAGVYLSGNGAIKYLDIKRFDQCDIELKFSSFYPAKYPQEIETFIPGLSVLDVILNIGWEATSRYISNERAVN